MIAFRLSPGATAGAPAGFTAPLSATAGEFFDVSPITGGITLCEI